MRRFLAFAGLLLAIAGTAMAASGDDARQYVDMVGKQVLSVINASGENKEQKQQKLQQMFTQYVDMDWMARFVLGPAWQSAAPDARNRYMNAYRQYLLARYTTNFADYSGSKYTITGVKDEGNGQFTVSMNISSPHEQQQETEAGYRLRADQNGQFKIVDIIIEGVSLLTTQRSEFASVLQKKNMDALIHDLEAKTQDKKP